VEDAVEYREGGERKTRGGDHQPQRGSAATGSNHRERLSYGQQALCAARMMPARRSDTSSE
jgi:hypothetical protein